MEENLKVDKDYKTAFNLGYELAKELDLTTPMFKDLDSDNESIKAMQAGMKQYSNEVIQGRHIENVQHKDSKIKLRNIANSDSKKKNKRDMDKGLDFSN